MRPGLDRHPVYAALYQPVLVVGLPRSVLGPEVTVLALGVYSFGWSLSSFVFAAIVCLGLHPLLIRAVRDDVEVVEVFVRALRLRDIYQPQAGYGSPETPFCTSLGG